MNTVQLLLSEIITIAIAMTGAVFAYGKLLQRVGYLEERMRSFDSEMKQSLVNFQARLTEETHGLREEAFREIRRLEAKFQSVEQSIEVLRKDVYSMRERLYEENTQIRALLYEIKGRLETRKELL
jgi:dynactin complex subunit